MKAGRIFRWLLRLYPKEFRRQFSGEMTCVFEQRAVESSERAVRLLAVLLVEFLGVVKGASCMRLTNILFLDRDRASAGAESLTLPVLTIEQAMKLRDTAIRNMMAAIANHDFANARRFSDEDTRLRYILESLQINESAPQAKLA